MTQRKREKKTFDERMKDIPACFGTIEEYNPNSEICISCKYQISCAAHIRVTDYFKEKLMGSDD